MMDSENEKKPFDYMKKIGLANLMGIVVLSFFSIVTSSGSDAGIFMFFVGLGIMVLEFCIGVLILVVDPDRVNLAAALMASSAVAGILGFSICLGLNI